MLITEYRAVARGIDDIPLAHPSWPQSTWETYKASLRQARQWAARALLNDAVASVAINASVLPARGQDWQDGPVFEVIDDTTAAPWSWVAADWDKPHRCPDCRRVAERAWSKRGYGPRTRFRCVYGCRVQWRVGNRAERRSRGE